MAVPDRPRPIKHRWRPTLGLWLAYALLAALLTWPTVTHLATFLPGDGGDDPAIAWNLWWVKHALLVTGSNPFQTDFLFYPIGINLAFYTLTVLNATLALPLTLNLGVVAASNLHLFFTFVTGGYGVFLLARYVLGADDRPGLSPEWLGAALAGLFYAFASSQLFYVALGQFNIASSHWVPYTMLYVLRTGRRPARLKNALLAGLFLTLQAWTEMTYASFLLVFIGLYWLYRLLLGAGQRRPAWPRLAPHLPAALVLGLTFGLGLSPILAQMLPDLRAEGDFLVEGSGFAESFSADLLGFVIPTMHHPLLGGLVTHSGIRAFDKGQHIYLGFVLPGLALLGLIAGRRRPELLFWGVAAGVFGLLCLGPVITIAGQATGLPGPFVLFQNLPFFKGNRYPSRYGVMLLLSLSIAAAYGLCVLGRFVFSIKFLPVSPSPARVKVSRLVLAVPLLLIPLLFLFEHLALPLPQSNMRVPPPYELIAAEPGDFTILDIPFAWRNGFRITGALTTQFMFGQFYQTFHQKKLLQGNTSRNPAFKFQYFTGAPVINSLLALETGRSLPAGTWTADRAIAPDVLRFLNVRYVVIRPYRYPWFNGAAEVMVTEQAVIPYVEDVLPVEKIYDRDGFKIYRIQDSSTVPAGLTVDTARPLAPLVFGQGWGLVTPGRPVAAQRREVQLLLPLAGGPQVVTIRLRRPDFGPAAGQTARLALNGWQSSPQPVMAGWQELAFPLPASAVRPGLNDIRLRFEQVSPLPDARPGEAPDVTVLSAGQEVGSFGTIFVNGRQVSPNERGYNVAVIRPGQAPPLVAAFDTHLDPAAGGRLADFIAAAPADALLAVAAADEASASLGGTAVQALAAAGAAGDLRGCFRCSHAFIRAGTGPTLEALDPLRPVGLATGLGLTEPQVGALVEWVQVENAGPATVEP